MANLDAVLRITAQNDTGKVLEAIKKEIAEMATSIVDIEKAMLSVGRISGEMNLFRDDGQREAIDAAVHNMERLVTLTEKASAAQRSLAQNARSAAAAMSREGGGGGGGVGGGGGPRVVVGRAGGGGGRHRGVLGVAEEFAPFAGPELEEGVKAYFHAGATVEEQIARLKAAGVGGGDIDRARTEYRDFAKKHAGVLESDYLGFFKDATTIAPGESHDMAQLGALYKTSLRNSGISSSEYDVGNVLRIMDELGLKSQGDRVGFLDNFLKSQQAFGNQINTETALAAYRNAKQSIYGWSPDFRDKYFPTLLQSAGQQGGTEMMTALNNFVGGHMSHAELTSLADAGFVDRKDLMVNPKTGDIKGLKKGAHLFEKDMFEKNIAQWSWDFHDEFMKRKGSTEEGFSDLIAKMPRNMAGLVAFLNHNRDRIQRDAQTLEKPIGFKAADNAFLGENPVAGLEALKTAIEQFAGAVSEPAMKAVGTNLGALAQGIQTMAASYGDFAKQHPELARNTAVAAGAAGAGAAGWSLWKLYSGVSNLLGFGAGAGVGEGGAAAGGLLGGAFAPLTALAGLAYELGNSKSDLNAWMKENLNSHPAAPVADDWATTGKWRTQVAYARQWEDHPYIGAWGRDMENAHARAMSGPADQHGPVEALPLHGDVTGKFEVVVSSSSELLSVFNNVKQLVTQIPLNPNATGHSGRMDSDATPPGGKWDR
jgi:hypothetical protein